MRRNPALIFAGLALGGVLLAGCTAGVEDATGTDETVAQAASVESGYTELTYEALGIDEAASVDTASAEDLTLSGSEDVTISQAGTYRLSGTLTDASVIVNVDSGQVNLILDGASITADETAAINIVSADAVVVYLAEGSTNTLSDASTAAASTDEEAPTAVLFSKTDLFIEGPGSLTVSASINDAITSKDSLVIEGGTISVDAADDGVNGKDHIVVLDGVLTINAGGDGIKASNDEVLTDASSTKGVAWFSGGSVDITAGDDGITAERQVSVDGGSLSIAATDDGVHSEGVLSVSGGDIVVSESNEGLEGAVLLLSGGTADVTATDDGINAAGGYLSEATTTADAAGTEGGQGDTGAAPGGEGQMPTEGERPSRDGGGPQGGGGMGGGGMGGDGPQGGGGAGGDSSVTDPSQLTVTTASGSGEGPMMGGDSAGSGRYLSISGGTWTVDAQGDGVDVNGEIVISGGTLTVAGPSANNNGAIDADTGFTITGGTVVANGSSGMLVTPGEDSTQASVVAVFSGGVAAGSVISIADASGNELTSYTTVRVSQAVIFSSADVVAGDSYAVNVDGTEVGSIEAR